MPTVHTLNERHIVAHTREPIEVKVKGYGTTGYMWKVAVNADKVRVVDHKFEPDLTAFGAQRQRVLYLGASHQRGDRGYVYTRGPVERRTG